MLDETPSSVPIFRNGHTAIERKAWIFDRILIDNSVCAARLGPGDGSGSDCSKSKISGIFLNKLDGGVR